MSTLPLGRPLSHRIPFSGDLISRPYSFRELGHSLVTSQRPNILFLMSDQHRPDVIGYQVDSVVRTPVLDELARTGVVFNNAYTPAPVCIPARQSMAAGQLPRTCGCEVFGDDLAPGHMTFARRLSQYRLRGTVACGKLHHSGTDQMQGWTRRIGAEMSVRHDYIEGRDLEAFRDLPLATEHKWSQAKEVKRAGIGQWPHHRARRIHPRRRLALCGKLFRRPVL